MEVRIEIRDDAGQRASLSLNETKELLATLIGLVVPKTTASLDGHYGVDKEGNTVPMSELIAKVYD